MLYIFGMHLVCDFLSYWRSRRINVRGVAHDDGGLDSTV